MIHYPRAGACLFTRLRAEESSWWHHDEPSHNYKMAAKSAIMIHYPRAAACLYRETRSSRRARVQEELNMIHYPSLRAAACIFTRLRVEESVDFIEAHRGVPLREKPYEIVIYLYKCVFDL